LSDSINPASAVALIALPSVVEASRRTPLPFDPDPPHPAPRKNIAKNANWK